MVDPIGLKPIATSDRTVARAPSLRPRRAPAAARTRRPRSVDCTAVGARRRAPPVDAERVAQIKKAIADGTFPLPPATIADRLIALKFEWTRNDPA